MFSISTDDHLTATITGEFWDFDRLYFAISKFTGDFGIGTPCPFPGYENVCESLLGLNYELRHAMSGERGVTEYYSGIPEYWIAPEGQEGRVRSNTKENAQKSDDDFNIETFEDSILMNIPIEMEWDTFVDMDEDDKMELLLELGYEEEECELYFRALEEENHYKFSHADVPHFTGYNSLLSLEMPLSEAVYYALILRELLPKKDAYAAHCRKLMEENASGLGDIHAEYYYIGMHVDVARMEAFAWQVLQALYRVLREDYKGFEEAYDRRPELFLHADLRKMNGLLERYARCDEAASARDVMKEYCELLMEVSLDRDAPILYNDK